MEVAFEPYKKVTFQSHLRYDTAEEYAKVIALLSPQEFSAAISLLWGNGILFRFFGHNYSEALAKEELGGHLIFDHIEFAPMPTFKSEIKVPERPLVKINVIDVSKHIVFGPLTAWIQDNLLRT